MRPDEKSALGGLLLATAYLDSPDPLLGKAIASVIDSVTNYSSRIASDSVAFGVEGRISGEAGVLWNFKQGTPLTWSQWKFGIEANAEVSAIGKYERDFRNSSSIRSFELRGAADISPFAAVNGLRGNEDADTRKKKLDLTSEFLAKFSGSYASTNTVS